jgi:death-on-curing protein
VKEPRWFSLRAAIAAHEESLREHGGLPGIRDRGGLEAALARPQNLLAYSERKLTLFDLAAAYAFGITRAHPFVDGNKRTAAIVSMAFLDRKGIQIAAPQVEVYQTFTTLAAGELSEHGLAQWFERYSEPLK